MVSLEYHGIVRRLISPSIVLGLLTPFVIFVSTGQAQINGTPSSVTSPGFGGRPVNGPPASVTSLGPQGYAPTHRGTFVNQNVPHNGDGHHRRHHYVQYAPPVAYVPVPYAVDIGATDEADDNADDSDPNYQGGPTIFDRRGAGAASYIPPVNDVPHPHATQDANASESVPDPPEQPTLLIFKDGRQLEVGNYAILGATLFDLTPGHPRKIAIADLDLEATRKQNDDRGVTFQLPPSSQAN
jgi:hypothetical protein